MIKKLVAQTGFTLVEIMIVVAVMAIILSIGLPAVNNWQINSQVNETTSLLIENLRLAEQDSQAGWQNNSYGIKFLPDSYVIYQGANYATRQVGQDRMVPLGSSLKIELSLVPLIDEIPFNRQGFAQSTGTIKIVQGDINKSFIINNYGIIFRP